MTGIFINYRTKDGAFAAALVDERLRREFGDENVFLDSRSLRLGVRFPPKLWNHLAECTVLLTLIGPYWLTLTDRQGRRLIDDPDDYERYSGNLSV
jgi:hypothetical protein